jgi:hypothetical protein
MGKNLGLLRSWDEFGRPGDGGSGTMPRALDQLGRSGACWAARSGAPVAATRTVRRRRAGLVRRFQPMAEKKNKKGCLFFNLF